MGQRKRRIEGKLDWIFLRRSAILVLLCENGK